MNIGASRGERSYADLVKQLKSDTKEQASIVRNQYVELKSIELGVSKKKLMQVLESADRGVLECDFVLTLNDNSTVLVDEVCSNPRNWDRVSLRDPLDPDDGASKAMIMVGDDHNIRINSFAHGGCLYRLTGKPVELYSSIQHSSLDDAEKFLEDFSKKTICDLDRMDEVDIL